jgi:hypothetical protein
MYISEWDLRGAATSYYQQLVPQGRNIHPGTWHSSMYISEWDLRGATSYYQQLVPQGEIYTGTWHSMYIRSYTVLRTFSAACAKGRNIHPGTWHSSMYISEHLPRAKLTLPAAGISTLGLGLIYILACDWTETYLLPTSLGIKVRVLPLPLPGIGSGAKPISLFRTRGSSKPKWHGAQKQASVFFTRPTENGLGPGKVWDGTIAEMPFSAGWYNGIMEITDEEYE